MNEEEKVDETYYEDSVVPDIAPTEEEKEAEKTSTEDGERNNDSVPGEEEEEEQEKDPVEEAVTAYCRENGHGNAVRKMMIRLTARSDIEGDEEEVQDALDQICLQAIDKLKAAKARKAKLAEAKAEIEASERTEMLQKIMEIPDKVSAVMNKLVATENLHCIFWEDLLSQVHVGDYDVNIFKDDAVWILYCVDVIHPNEPITHPWMINAIATLVNCWQSPGVAKATALMEKEAEAKGYSKEQIKAGTENFPGKDPYEYKYYQSAVRAANDWKINVPPISINEMLTDVQLRDCINKMEDRTSEKTITRVETTRSLYEAAEQAKQEGTWQEKHKLAAAACNIMAAPSAYARNFKEAKKQAVCSACNITEEEYEADREKRQQRKEEKRKEAQERAQAKAQMQSNNAYGNGMYTGAGLGRNRQMNSYGSYGQYGNRGKSGQWLPHVIAGAVSIIIVLLVFLFSNSMVKNVIITLALTLLNVGAVLVRFPTNRKKGFLTLAAGTLFVLLLVVIK